MQGEITPIAPLVAALLPNAAATPKFTTVKFILLESLKWLAPRLRVKIS